MLLERMKNVNVRRLLTVKEAKRLSKLPLTTIVLKATTAKASRLLLRSYITRVKAFVRIH